MPSEHHNELKAALVFINKTLKYQHHYHHQEKQLLFLNLPPIKRTTV